MLKRDFNQMNNLQAGEGPGHGGNGQAEMEGHQAQGEV
jgi:hypothetical protein